MELNSIAFSAATLESTLNCDNEVIETKNKKKEWKQNAKHFMSQLDGEWINWMDLLC